MRALRPRGEALTTGLLDELARQDPSADLIEVLAVPLPILVICELLGVPYEDRACFRSWTGAAAGGGVRKAGGPGCPPRPPSLLGADA